MFKPLPPLSLYIHLPWCVRKCPYCDFNSHRAPVHLPTQRYLEALRADLHEEATRAAGREVESIFLGGGTPSLFPPDDMQTLLDDCARSLDLSASCEITMEANPGTLEQGRLQGFFDAGVNRLSIGAQSFNADSLKILGRIHSPDDIKVAFAEARVAGFNSINVDVMFALPGQTLEMAANDIEALLALAPDHVSYYQLTLEPNTVFFSSPPAGLPDDELSYAIQSDGQRRLRDAGFEQYEVSAFARAGHRCRHNLNYWTYGDYLAIGAGAHGKWTSANGVIHRYSKPANPQMYMQAMAQSPSTATTAVETDELGFEFMLNALRLADGFSADLFQQRTGQSIDSVKRPIEQAISEGLLQPDSSNGWRPTGRGYRFLNDLQQRFLP